MGRAVDTEGRLDIAGLVLGFTSKREVPLFSEARYLPFQTTRTPDWRFCILVARKDSLFRRGPRPDVQWTGDEVRIGSENFAAHLSLTDRSGELVLRGSFWPLERALKVCMSLITAHKDGFLLHASGLVYRDFGFVFSGRSGSGKTTITGLSGTSPILSDDIVAIRRQGKTFFAFGTPFGGVEEIVRGEVEVKAYLSLKKGKHPFLTALEPFPALANLLKNILSLPQSGLTAGRLLESAQKFIEKIKCYVLTFPPDPSFWKLIKAL